MISLINCCSNNPHLLGLLEKDVPLAILPISGEKSLVQKLYELQMRNSTECYVCLRQPAYEKSEVLLSALPGVKYVVEPVHKGTGPLLALISLRMKDEIIVFSPSWFIFEDEEAYLKTLKEAEEMAQNGKIVRIGRYLLVYKASVMVEEMKKHCPELLECAQNVYDNRRLANITLKFNGELMEKFKYTTIADAVLSKSDRYVSMPRINGSIAMDNYQNIYEKTNKDKDGNAAVNIGDTYGVAEFAGAKNNMVMMTEKDVTLMGVEDIVVIDTGKKILIAKKGEDIQARLKELEG